MTTLDRLIRFSLQHQLLVLSLGGLLLLGGALWTAMMPVDIFPDLSAPTVTVVTEAPGLAPEDVEQLVTFPLESAVNGATDVRRLRSVSADGISVIWVEFTWGVDIFRARQIVSERLQRVALPSSAERPELGPISSIMGEITFVALTASEKGDQAISPMKLRRLADTVVRRNLLALPGVSQVVAIGGTRRQLQITARPEDLARYGLALSDLTGAARDAGRSPAAGFHVDGGQEYLVRSKGRVTEADDLSKTVVAVLQGVPVRIEDVADVAWGPEPSRGAAGYNGKPAVVLSVQKQPDANTLELTAKIDEILADLGAALPSGVVIETENFRQADFIEVAIHNITEALRDGAILVVLVLFAFLGSWRTTLISALAIPLSLVAGALVVSFFGGTINTMTLGGLTIAIGALVDDAIIDVENVFRRLRLERDKSPDQRRPALEVVFQASSEVRKAIFFATLIIVLVFLPLFLLPGLEGRLLRPLGLAYVAALSASLLVSMTVTPVLCLLLLPRSGSLDARDTWLLRRLHGAYRPTLSWVLGHRGFVVGATVLIFATAVSVLPLLGRSFLPRFNEGALTVGVTSTIGIPLEESDRLGQRVEEALLAFPEVVSTSRRTGRAEKDEHVQGVNRSELEVVLRPLENGRTKDEMLAEMRSEVTKVPGVATEFGQPISHRIDHMISGSRTNLAVKVFGPDLTVLRGLAERIEGVLAEDPSIVDLSNAEQASIPQLVIDFDRPAMARFGLSTAELSDSVEALFQGAAVGEVIDKGLTSSTVVRYSPSLRLHRERLTELPVTTAEGNIVRLDDVADVRFDLGPSLVRRENVERVAMVTANVVGADLTGTVRSARESVAAKVDLPEGYVVTFDGQFEEAARSVRNLGALSAGVLLGMYGLLYLAFGTHRETLVVLVNLPLALLGGIFAVLLGGGVLSLASLVGFITLFGIATRNGVLLVSHYQHLRYDEGLGLTEAVRRGSRERLAPILMTALTAGLALIPLVLRGSEPGNEIQSPMGQVILGGLLTSTFLNLLLVPLLYERWAPDKVGRPRGRRGLP
ncbi:MAG: efflux RND transporter permease subunit [Thermoanaerobaculia bacterium]|nr:efflux RND transporter permease subunit [Thermoanaerobaculia bacterium]